MFVLTQVSILDAFIIFFFSLGPLNALGPFAQATRGADPAFRRTVAWRATAITTAIVIGVALVGSVTLETWRVSVAAVVVSGSMIHHLHKGLGTAAGLGKLILESISVLCVAWVWSPSWPWPLITSFAPTVPFLSRLQCREIRHLDGISPGVSPRRRYRCHHREPLFAVPGRTGD